VFLGSDVRELFVEVQWPITSQSRPPATRAVDIPPNHTLPNNPLEIDLPVNERLRPNSLPDSRDLSSTSRAALTIFHVGVWLLSKADANAVIVANSRRL